MEMSSGGFMFYENEKNSNNAGSWTRIWCQPKSAVNREMSPVEGQNWNMEGNIHNILTCSLLTVMSLIRVMGLSRVCDLDSRVWHSFRPHNHKYPQLQPRSRGAVSHITEAGGRADNSGQIFCWKIVKCDSCSSCIYHTNEWNTRQTMNGVQCISNLALNSMDYFACF